MACRRTMACRRAFWCDAPLSFSFVQQRRCSPTLAQVDADALSDSAHVPPRHVRVSGELVNANSVERFAALDRKALFSGAAARIWCVAAAAARRRFVLYSPLVDAPTCFAPQARHLFWRRSGRSDAPLHAARHHLRRPRRTMPRRRRPARSSGLPPLTAAGVGSHHLHRLD